MIRAKRRARLATMAAALAGVGVIAALLVLHGREMGLWRIRLAGDRVIVPAPGSRPGETVGIEPGDIVVEDILRFIADSTGRAIIVEAGMRECLRSTITMATRMDDVTAAIAMRILEANRFAFVDRGFPGGFWELSPGRPGCGLTDDPQEGGPRAVLDAQ
jgi:hypothetical protein